MDFVVVVVEVLEHVILHVTFYMSSLNTGQILPLT